MSDGHTVESKSRFPQSLDAASTPGVDACHETHYDSNPDIRMYRRWETDKRQGPCVCMSGVCASRYRMTDSFPSLLPLYAAFLILSPLLLIIDTRSLLIDCSNK